MNRLRQNYLAVNFYAEDNGDWWPFKGYEGYFLHCFQGEALKKHIIDTYLAKLHETLYCPSANYTYNHKNHRCTDQYFGYFYTAGACPGPATDPSLGWRWFTSHTFQIVFVRRKCLNPSETPLMMDAAAVLGTRNRQEQASRPAFPANNHETKTDPAVPAFENIAWQAGNVTGIGDPASKTRRTDNMACQGYLYW